MEWLCSVGLCCVELEESLQITEPQNGCVVLCCFVLGCSGRVLTDHRAMEWLGCVGRVLTEHRAMEWLCWVELEGSLETKQPWNG